MLVDLGGNEEEGYFSVRRLEWVGSPHLYGFFCIPFCTFRGYFFLESNKLTFIKRGEPRLQRNGHWAGLFNETQAGVSLLGALLRVSLDPVKVPCLKESWFCFRFGTSTASPLPPPPCCIERVMPWHASDRSRGGGRGGRTGCSLFKESVVQQNSPNWLYNAHVILFCNGMVPCFSEGGVWDCFERVMKYSELCSRENSAIHKRLDVCWWFQCRPLTRPCLSPLGKSPSFERSWLQLFRHFH